MNLDIFRAYDIRGIFGVDFEPILLVLEYLSVKEISLAESVNCLRAAYPVSGEINFSFETDRQMQDALAAVDAALHC